MINFDTLHKAKKTKIYTIKKTPNIKLWKVVSYDNKPYYAIIKTVDGDSSVTVIIDKLKEAIRTFKQLKRSSER